MVNKGEIHALVSLLDDPDPEVLNQVKNRFFSLGIDSIPIIENEFFHFQSEIHQNRLDAIIRQIRLKDIKDGLKRWKLNDSDNLLKGIFLVNKYGVPEITFQELNNRIDKIRLECWLEMHYDLTSFEKIKIMNHIFFDVFQFSGKISDYHSSSNSFLSKVIEDKGGNPVSMAILYSLVAQKLEMPVYGVNLPQHFLLAYTDPEYSLNDYSSVLFYINPFNKGSVYSRSHIDQYLKGLELKSEAKYVEPCSNLEIIKRVLRNLSYSYELEGNSAQIKEVNQLLDVLNED